MKTIEICETKKVKNGQMELSFKFDEGSVVVLDGIDYQVINENTVQVSKKYNGRMLLISYSYSCDENISVITNNPREKSLYKSYSNGEYILENNKYTVSLDLDNEKLENVIYSKMNPFYSTVSKIRNDTGDLLQEYSDDIISKFIYSNSVIAFELLGYDEETEEDEIEITNAAKQYVRYKSDLDLVNAVYLSIVNKYGVTKKQLSSLSIEYNSKLPILDDMLKYFKDKVNEYEDELMNGSGNITVVSAVRAGNTTYPIDSRNSF